MIMSTARPEKINEVFCFKCLSFRLSRGITEECDNCGSSLVIVAGMGTLDVQTMKDVAEAVRRLEEVEE